MESGMVRRVCCACGVDQMVWRGEKLCPRCGANFDHARAAAFAAGPKANRVKKYDGPEISEVKV